jgi:hypothetical protein
LLTLSGSSTKKKLFRFEASEHLFSALKTAAVAKIKQSESGTDVMIFKIVSPKNLAKIWAFFAKTTASFCKTCDHNIGF